MNLFPSQPFYTTCLRQQATTCGVSRAPFPLNPHAAGGPYFIAFSIFSRFSLMVSR